MELSGMGPHEAPGLSYPEDLWLNWFKDEIFNADIDDTGAKSVLHYLFDLNLLINDGGQLFKILGVQSGQSSNEVKKILLKKMNTSYHTEVGFALVYFISNFSKSKLPPLKLKEHSSDVIKKNIFGKSSMSRQKKTSNLSNLQIVQKLGNQLRPFLDLERQTISRLRGAYTSKTDAQWLFNYILDKTRKKSPAKKWEQLSRKRHR